MSSVAFSPISVPTPIPCAAPDVPCCWDDVPFLSPATPSAVNEQVASPKFEPRTLTGALSSLDGDGEG